MCDMKNLANSISAKVLARLEDKLQQFFDNINNEWMTTKEAAVYLRITEGNLRGKVSRGQIQVHGRLGRSWRFRRDELDKLLNNPNQGVFDD